MKINAARLCLVLFPPLILLLLAVDVLLLRQSRELSARLAASTGYFEPRIGRKLPPLHGTDMDGRPMTLSYNRDPRRTLLLMFSPECGACAANWPAWFSIIGKADRATTRIVLVDSSSKATKEFVTGLGIQGIPVFGQVDLRSMVEYRIEAVPQTVLTGPEGTVLKAWVGRLDKDRFGEVVKAIQN